MNILKKIVFLGLIASSLPIVHAQENTPTAEDHFQALVSRLALMETALAYCNPSPDEQRSGDQWIEEKKNTLIGVQKRRFPLVYEERLVDMRSVVLSKGADTFCEQFGLDILSSLEKDSMVEQKSMDTFKRKEKPVDADHPARFFEKGGALSSDPD